MSRFKCFYDIGRITRRGKTDEQISFFADTFNDPRINDIKAIIIADCREVRSIAMQRLSRQSSPVHIKPAGEFSREMLRISRTSSIAAEIDPFALPECTHDLVNNFADYFQQLFILQDLLLH